MALGDPIPIPVADKIITYTYLGLMSAEEKEAFYKQEAKALIDWARKSEALTISSFYCSRGYARSTFYNFIKNSPELAHALEMAKHVITARYQEGGLTGKLHPNFALRLLPLVDKEYRDMCSEMQLNSEVSNSYEDTRKRAINAELELARLRAKIQVLEEDAVDGVVKEGAAPYHEPSE